MKGAVVTISTVHYRNLLKSGHMYLYTQKYLQLSIKWAPSDYYYC